MENESTQKGLGNEGFTMNFEPGSFSCGFKSSPQLNELFSALSKAQGTMESAKKDSDNPFFRTKYADLHSCWQAIRNSFSQNGLSVIQLNQEGNKFIIKKDVVDEKTGDVKTIETEGKTIKVVTILGHSSGQWISSVTELKPVKTDPQGMGSALTYARRYGLVAIAGISQEDDDGAAGLGTPGSHNPQTQKRPAPRTQLPPAKVSRAQLSRLHAIANQTNWSKDDMKRLLDQEFGLKSSKDLKRDAYDQVVKIIQENEPSTYFEG